PMALARRLEVSHQTVRRWLDRGWVRSRRDAEGRTVIWADAAELERLGRPRRPARGRSSGPRPGEAGGRARGGSRAAGAPPVEGGSDDGPVPTLEGIMDETSAPIPTGGARSPSAPRRA